jgi:four helix bundle protein
VPKVGDGGRSAHVEDREFARKLERRTRDFAIKIILLSASLPGTPEGRAIRTQITKAGTSIGANYREANRARSKADFRNRIDICEAEASETQYWLEIITKMEWLSRDGIEVLYDECSELLAIFPSIGKK